MATGFMQRFKGRIKAAEIFLDATSLTRGLFDAASGTRLSAVWTHAGAPTNGTSGTLFGYALPGDLMVDITNKVLYQNTNTQASPTWTALTTATGAGTYTGTFDGVVGGSTPAAATVTTLTASGLVTESVATGLTASVTQTRTGALALTKQVNNITVCATSGNAVSLPAATVGQAIVIFNGGANPASVFPAGASDTIDGGSGGAAVTLTNAKRCIYFCVAANTWISAQLGLASA